MSPGRDDKGKFRKGYSGNPGGKKPKADAEFLVLCKTHSPLLLRDRIEAWTTLSDSAKQDLIEFMAGYAYGKPRQQVDVEGSVKHLLQVDI